ncbi:pentatricopeptide repeat-containing protein At5g43790-like [Pyrus communis]|uniref:pentatricopeptide repeat-containing protein At5g43790-like n=1 Tax=Pyrus communis TaxID=23211 RepID=UPI0035C244DF
MVLKSNQEHPIQEFPVVRGRFEVFPDRITFSSLIKACANQAALGQGIQLHAQAVKVNLDRDPFVFSVYVDMYGKCGLLDDSTQVFHEIANPTEVAWNSLLVVLALHGLNYFHSMEKTYGIVPRDEHYSCVIDLLGRAGRLTEAEEFINSMPIPPNAFGWCSFLEASRIHGDKKRGKLAAEKLMQLEPENIGGHVLKAESLVEGFIDQKPELLWKKCYR